MAESEIKPKYKIETTVTKYDVTGNATHYTWTVTSPGDDDPKLDEAAKNYLLRKFEMLFYPTGKVAEFLDSIKPWRLLGVPVNKETRPYET